MAEIITKALKDMKARQKELQPLVAEYHQIESAIKAFEESNGGAPTSSRGRTRTATRRSGRRRGRPRKGEPTRADQFLALVKEQPGVTISQAAKHLAVQPNYLYRVAAGLEQKGEIGRDGKGFKPREASGAVT